MAEREIYIGDRLILHPEAGTLDVVHEAKIVLGDATAQISYHRGGEPHQFLLSEHTCDYRVSHDRVIISAGNEDVLVAWHIRLGAHTLFSLRVTNRSRLPLHLDDLAVLLVPGGVNLGGHPATWRFYQNGWQSWSPAGVRSCGEIIANPDESRYAPPPYVEPGDDDYRRKHLPHDPGAGALLSHWFTVIKGSECSFLAGFVTTAQHLGYVRLWPGDGGLSLSAVCAGDAALLPADASIVSESLLCAVSRDPYALLDLHMNETAQAMSARLPDAVPTGWCTWYYFYGENSENDVLANVVAIKEKRLPLEYILLDDGYQAAIGDWTSFSARFPHGIPWLVEQIRSAGFRPGIWIAPFGVAQDSRLYTEHPDWVLTGKDGSPLVAWQHMGVAAPILALDCTHPEVQSWLSNLFQTMADEWGIEMFKIDFCFAAALPGRRYDVRATRAMALRQGLQVIREAIGDCFLLGCGVPLAPALGIVDGMRISTDVAITWNPFFPDPAAPSTRNALLNVVARYASHGKLWLNDPDCVIARQRADENDLKLEETRTLATLLGLSGGMILSGDNITTLTSGRVRYLQKLLPPSNSVATPLDLFESETPRLLALPCNRANTDYLLLTAINWDDTPRAIALDLDALLADSEIDRAPQMHAYDLTREVYLGVVVGRFMLGRLPSHASRLILLQPVSNHPDLLASTFHVLGGLVEVKQVVWEDRHLRVEVDKPGCQPGKLVFTCPPPYRPQSVVVNNRRRRVPPVRDGIIEVGLTLDNHATVVLAFAPS